MFTLLGSVKVWDPRQKDEPVANMSPVEGQDARDCWCVAFGKCLISPNSKGWNRAQHQLHVQYCKENIFCLWQSKMDI